MKTKSASDDRNPVLIGQRPRSRRQAVTKTLSIGVWLLYLAGPVGELAGPRYSIGQRVWGAVGLALFVLAYTVLIFRHVWWRPPVLLRYAPLVLMLALSIALSWTLGSTWLVLFIFTSVASAVVLPWQRSRWAIPVTTAVLIAVGARFPEIRAYYLFAYALPALGSGYVMIGVQNLIRTTKELRAAREEVARLAANEERLRLARDLHDLLGHSLSLITLKSELAGRMLPGSPEEAAKQVADIERVSRQALVDVREAVTGYRRPRLAVELAGARAALRTAGIALTADPAFESGHPGLTDDTEGALAWALREAVTNVVRHSRARRCELLLTEERETGERRSLCLTVTDDGDGPPRSRYDGNGLTGLRERLTLTNGRLETAPATPTHGFTLRAYVPITTPASPEPISLPDCPREGANEAG
ncbi:histidine kinase [Streptomyces sp. NRRL F-4489]|uniref:sensor histidine kinase n=1 Tax=Streptomyces sp. NRRL F-4489 TaxID=1609095 RepID=UPI00074AE38C|nr:sensor histidine kinase [Streptomyces sp. NRRL F-4489]KUL37442.1 histidine kinase [Streptomyces sp. NRRL F-4489]